MGKKSQKSTRPKRPNKKSEETYTGRMRPVKETYTNETRGVPESNARYWNSENSQICLHSVNFLGFFLMFLSTLTIEDNFIVRVHKKIKINRKKVKRDLKKVKREIYTGKETCKGDVNKWNARSCGKWCEIWQKNLKSQPAAKFRTCTHCRAKFGEFLPECVQANECIWETLKAEICMCTEYRAGFWEFLLDASHQVNVVNSEKPVRCYIPYVYVHRVQSWLFENFCQMRATECMELLISLRPLWRMSSLYFLV